MNVQTSFLWPPLRFCYASEQAWTINKSDLHRYSVGLSRYSRQILFLQRFDFTLVIFILLPEDHQIYKIKFANCVVKVYIDLPS